MNTFNDILCEYKKDEYWEKLGFLKGINNKTKEKEVINWFNKAVDFLTKPTVEYKEGSFFETIVFPAIKRIVGSKYGPIDDFSIERLYEETNKKLPDDIELKISKTKDPEAEKLIYICNKFIKDL